MSSTTAESERAALSRPPGGWVGPRAPIAVAEPLSAALVPPLSLDLDRAVWGVDPSTQRVAVGCVLPRGQGLRWDTLSLPRMRVTTDPRRFAAAYDVLVPWLTEHARLWGFPSRVLVEQPFAKGRNVQPSSQQMVGVVLAALGKALPDVELGLIDPARWKKQALGAGHGHADPAEYTAWARTVGYTGQVEDECAALGVATACAVG